MSDQAVVEGDDVQDVNAWTEDETANEAIERVRQESYRAGYYAALLAITTAVRCELDAKAPA